MSSALRAQMDTHRDELVGAAVVLVSALIVLLLPTRPPSFWGLQWVDAVRALEGAQQAGLPLPLPGPRHGPLWPALLATWLWSGPAVVEGLRFMAMLATLTTVWGVYYLAQSAGGWRAGVAAVAILWCSPPFLFAVTTLEPTIFVLGTSVGAGVTLLRARTSTRWVPLALIATTLLLLTHVVGWVMLLIAGYLFLADGARGVSRGLMHVPPLSLGMVLVPIALVLAVKVSPAFGPDALDGLGAWLGAPLREGLEPSLAFGHHYGPRRVPVWLGPAYLMVKTPPALLPMIALGVGLWSPLSDGLRTKLGLASRSVSDPVEGMRAAWVYLAWFAALGAIAGGPYLGRARLFVLMWPWAAVLGGWALAWSVARAWSFARQEGMGAQLGVTVLLGLLAGTTLYETTWAGRHFEAYYSPLVARLDGAVQRGFSRAPHAPIAVAPLQEAFAAGAGHRVAILSSAWEYVPVLEHAIAAGELPEDVHFVRPAEADVYVLVLDDNLPELYDIMEEFQRLAQDPDAMLFQVGVHGTPLVMALAFRAP